MKKYCAVSDVNGKTVREILLYNPDTGIFTWRHRMSARVFAGDIAGCVHASGYIRISISGRLYCAHRLAFIYMTGENPIGFVDHINHIKTDNRWNNLRIVTCSENGKNQKLNKRNTSGIVGVTFRYNKWIARVVDNGKRITLGSFNTKEEAAMKIFSSRGNFGYHANHGSAAQ